MKKTAMTMVLVMVMLVMGAVALGEVKYTTDHVEKFTVGYVHSGNPVVEEIYYLKATSDTGDSFVFEASEKEYQKYARKEAFAEKTFFGKVGSVITFWNPND